MSQQSLTPPERETVILMDDETDFATVTSWQRKVITKLKKNPAAVLVWESSMGTSVGAQFRIPARLVSFRSRVVKGNADAGKRLAESNRRRLEQ